MNELITTINDGYTLKMFADVTIKLHKNLKRDFNKMIDNLSEYENQLLKFEPMVYTAEIGNGATREFETIAMDKRTALLFASKFNDSLRLALIMKIEEQQEKLLSKQQEIIERQAKHKLVTYYDGTESLRKIIRTYYPDVLGEREAWRHLVKFGIVEYKEKTTYVKELLDTKYGVQEQDSIRWNEEVCKILDKLADSKENGEKI